MASTEENSLPPVPETTAEEDAAAGDPGFLLLETAQLPQPPPQPPRTSADAQSLQPSLSKVSRASATALANTVVSSNKVNPKPVGKLQPAAPVAAPVAAAAATASAATAVKPVVQQNPSLKAVSTAAIAVAQPAVSEIQPSDPTAHAAKEKKISSKSKSDKKPVGTWIMYQVLIQHWTVQT